MLLRFLWPLETLVGECFFQVYRIFTVVRTHHKPDEDGPYWAAVTQVLLVPVLGLIGLGIGYAYLGLIPWLWLRILVALIAWGIGFTLSETETYTAFDKEVAVNFTEYVKAFLLGAMLGMFFN